MKQFWILLLSLLICRCTSDYLKENKLVNLVQNKDNTIISVPFGMVQVHPLKKLSGNALYFRGLGNIPEIVSETDLIVVPVIYNFSAGKGNAALPEYSIIDEKREYETCTPGYYSLYMDNSRIKSEVTATARTAFYRFTFPKDTFATVVLKFSNRITSDDNNPEITYNCVNNSLVTGLCIFKDNPVRQLFFAAQFSKPFRKSGFNEDGEITAQASSYTSIGYSIAILTFSTRYENIFKIKIGFSTASPDGAIENMKKEITGWTFENYRSDAEMRWENLLGKISVETLNTKFRSDFYTRLFECLHSPVLLSDYYFQYLSNDGNVNKSEGFSFFETKTSITDINEVMLLNILQPDEIKDFKLSAGEPEPVLHDSLPVFIVSYLLKDSIINESPASSAMMVLHAAGLNPVTSHGLLFKFTRPLTSRISFHLKSGKTMIIVCKNPAEKNGVIKKATLNGIELATPELSLKQFFEGGTLEIY